MIPIPLLGFVCGAAGVLLASAAFGAWLHWVHDPSVREAQTVAITLAVAKEKDASREASERALEIQGTLSAALNARTQSARERVIHAAPTTCPVAPAALRAAIMQQPASPRAGAR